MQIVSGVLPPPKTTAAKLRTAGWIIAACFAASACAAPSAHLPPLAAAAPGPYRLASGDELRIAVFGLTAINNNYIVDDGGMIALPLLGPTSVGGMSVREAEAVIAQHLRSREIVLDPKVSAQVVNYRPFFISGEVQRPGQYPCPPGMSLAKAVAIAGGYTFRADAKHATITRNTTKGRATADTAVLPDDVVVVPEAWF